MRPRLLAHAAHQEDGVVDAERHQEDEREDGQRRVDARGALHFDEEEDREPERAKERRHHRGDQHERRDDRAQQDPEDDRDDEQGDRDDHAEVPHGGIIEVFLHRAARADQRRDSAREVAQSVAKYLHARERRLE